MELYLENEIQFVGLMEGHIKTNVKWNAKMSPYNVMEIVHVKGEGADGWLYEVFIFHRKI